MARVARPRSLALVALWASSVSCATLGGESNNGINLPSSGVGPFRALVDGELAPQAIVPYVLSDQRADYSEPAIVAASDDPTSTAVWMYAVAHASGNAVIVRTSADDARSFYGDAIDNELNPPPHKPKVVLSSDQAWEGGDLAGPSGLRSGGQVWLYYAAAGGIGLATSTDGLGGLVFQKTSGPVLAVDPSVTWETTPPHAPSVAVFPDGTWHMMYGAGNAIGEATSPDGVRWTRAGTGPILSASAPPTDASAPPPGMPPPFDEGGVDDPLLAPQTTVDGRLQVRVLYTGYLDPPGTASRNSSIGLAGRFDDSGPLSRQSSPVYTAQLHGRAPAFFEWEGGSLLYLSEDDAAQTPTFPAIAAAFAPIDGTLPPPLPFPTAP
jgi:hypothetical protein